MVEIFGPQLNESTNQILKEVPKVVQKEIRKRYYKTLETSVITAQCHLPPCIHKLHPIILRVVCKERFYFSFFYNVTLDPYMSSVALIQQNLWRIKIFLLVVFRLILYYFGSGYIGFPLD